MRACFIELQKEMGKFHCLKLPVLTSWGSVLHCLNRLLKSKNIMERLENNEETNLSKRLGSSILDDEIFRMYVQKTVS